MPCAQSAMARATRGYCQLHLAAHASAGCDVPVEPKDYMYNRRTGAGWAFSNGVFSHRAPCTLASRRDRVPRHSIWRWTQEISIVWSRTHSMRVTQMH